MTVEVWLPLAPLAFFALVTGSTLVYRRVYGVRDRTAEEVTPFLRPVMVKEVEHLFAVATERFMRLNMTAQQFRRAQRQRMHLTLEYIRRISHNTLILQEWGTYEAGRARAAADSEISHLSTDLMTASVHCRICSFVLRVRLHTWLFRMAFLPFLTPPSFEALARFGSADLIEFYGNVRASAARLSRCYGNRYQNKLAELL